MGYRYRIQMGNEYTYRESGLELDHLIQDLLANDKHEQLDKRLDALLAKLRRSGVGTATPAQVKQVPHPPPKKRVAKLEEIKISLEEYAASKKPKWLSIKTKTHHRSTK